jgi:hypothetical protein
VRDNSECDLGARTPEVSHACWALTKRVSMRSLDVEVAERSTDEFSLAGGYSTVDGALAEVKMGENNFMGTG